MTNPANNNNLSLIPVPSDELTKLRDLYLKDWPQNCVGYYTLDNFIRWLQKDPQIKALAILTLNNDDWRTDGTFVLADRYQLFLNTLNPSNERLRIALSLLDWSGGYKVSSFLERHRPAVLDVVDTQLHLQKEYDSLTLVYHMPRDEAIQMEIDCPDGFVVRAMNEDDAVVADNVWPNQHVGSLFLLKRLIKWNPNVGVFTKANNELVAWCFRLQGGFLGALQVKDTHQRMGLGRLVLKSITKKIGQMDQDVMACVGHENTPSKRLFESCGFKVIDKAFWLRTYPTKDFEWTDKYHFCILKMNKNILVKIPYKDWPKLRDLYVNRKLESNSFNMIQNFINWLQKDPTLEEESVKLYSLNGDWSDGTFIIQDHKTYITMNTLEDSQERLLAALRCLDKKEDYILYGFHERLKKTIEAYVKDFEIDKAPRTLWHHVELKQALAFNTDPPEGITLSPIRTEDIETVNNLWPHHHPGSELFVGRLIRLGQSVGAYDNDGNLVSWCLTLPLGALGLLQVQESHRRKGFGSLMVKAMAKMNAEKGIETLAPIIEENTASRAMFKNLGFVEINEIFWYGKTSNIIRNSTKKLYEINYKSKLINTTVFGV
ncbi:uncharacterized protein LOC129906945 [Episyrphus balteatus]|uniref:uncharacterized protein LOC129906945 n=1 Tax=Episyrphus balteatus TaxID=286459 RepID=UPI0024853A6E|nr:uncharacterized protein LOC129906945 [Episyrphus balteatus]